MAKSKKGRNHSNQPAAAQGRRFTLILIVFLTIAAVAGVVFFMPGRQTVPGPPAQVPGADVQAIKGRWLRPDGGYILEIRNVSPDGRMEAGYFNPRPIHVSKAEVSKTGPTTNVFVELRDTNYPGSTYTMVYDPRDDVLKGIYYQAAIQESYEIVFVRMK